MSRSEASDMDAFSSTRRDEVDTLNKLVLDVDQALRRVYRAQFGSDEVNSLQKPLGRLVHLGWRACKLLDILTTLQDKKVVSRKYLTKQPRRHSRFKVKTTLAVTSKKRMTSENDDVLFDREAFVDPKALEESCSICLLELFDCTSLYTYE